MNPNSETPIKTKLIILVGVSGSTKSTFAEKYIKEHTFKYFDAYPIDLIKEKLKDFINKIS